MERKLFERGLIMQTKLYFSSFFTLLLFLGGVFLMSPFHDLPAAAAPSSESSAQKKPESQAAKPSITDQTAGSKTTPGAPKSAPVLLELKTTRDYFRASQDIMVQAELWAVQPVTLCVYPERPEASFVADLYRAGFGKLEISPSVVQLNRKEQFTMARVNLEPGQVHRMVFSLKKMAPMPPSFWKTGEYRIQVKFFLCGRTEQAELEIPSQGPLHLLVLE